MNKEYLLPIFTLPKLVIFRNTRAAYRYRRIIDDYRRLSVDDTCNDFCVRYDTTCLFNKYCQCVNSLMFYFIFVINENIGWNAYARLSKFFSSLYSHFRDVKRFYIVFNYLDYKNTHFEVHRYFLQVSI